jgi:hypothetical protein
MRNSDSVGQDSLKTPRDLSSIEAEFAGLQKTLAQLQQTAARCTDRLEPVLEAEPPAVATEARPARGASFSVLGSISAAIDQARDADRALQSILDRLQL